MNLNSNTDKKIVFSPNFNMLDVTKLILAYFVIALHCDVLNYSQSIERICKIAVPMFFVASGVLIQYKVAKEGYTYLKRYIKHIFRLFVIWTIIYIPLSIYGWRDEGLISGTLMYLRSTVMTGENFMSWPLWYLHALLFGSIIIYLLLKKNTPLSSIFIISFLLSLVGLLMDLCRLGGVTCAEYGITAKAIDVYYKIALHTRNGLFTSPLYLSIGMVLFENVNLLRRFRYILMATSLVSIPLLFMRFEYSYHICSLLFLASIISTNISGRIVYAKLRHLSSIMYFSHMIFIAIYKLILGLDYGFIIDFATISIITTIFGLIYIDLMKKYKLLNILL